MTDEIEAFRFQFKRGLAARWAQTNPVLASGEPGFERDTNKLKIGNGVAAWNDLPYIVDQEQVDGLVAAAITTALAGLQVISPAQVDVKISTALSTLNFITSAQVDTKISSAVGQLSIPSPESISTAIATAIGQLVIPTSVQIDAQIDTALGALTYVTPSQMEARIEQLVGDAPTALDTLLEISERLADDADVVAGLTAVVSGKASTQAVLDLQAALIEFQGQVYTKAEIDELLDDLPTGPGSPSNVVIHPSYEGLRFMYGPASAMPDHTEVHNVIYTVLPDLDGGVPL